MTALTPKGATLEANQKGRMYVPIWSPERLLVATKLPIAEVLCELDGVLEISKTERRAGHLLSPRARRVPCGSRRTGPSTVLEDAV